MRKPRPLRSASVSRNRKRRNRYLLDNSGYDIRERLPAPQPIGGGTPPPPPPPASIGRLKQLNWIRANSLEMPRLPGAAAFFGVRAARPAGNARRSGETNHADAGREAAPGGAALPHGDSQTACVREGIHEVTPATGPTSQYRCTIGGVSSSQIPVRRECEFALEERERVN